MSWFIFCHTIVSLLYLAYLWHQHFSFNRSLGSAEGVQEQGKEKCTHWVWGGLIWAWLWDEWALWRRDPSGHLLSESFCIVTQKKGHQTFSVIFLLLVDMRKSPHYITAAAQKCKSSKCQLRIQVKRFSCRKFRNQQHSHTNTHRKKIDTHLVSYYFTISERTKGMKGFVLVSNVTQWPLVWQWQMLSLLSKKSKVLTSSTLHKVAFKRHWGQGDLSTQLRVLCWTTAPACKYLLT